MSRSSHTTKSLEAGFTLVELLIVVIAGAILLLAFTGFYVAQQRSVRHNEVQIENSQNLRTVLEQMSRDIRAAGRSITVIDPTATLAPLTVGTATRVVFQYDTDDDGTPETKEYLYDPVGKNLQVCVNGNACEVLADRITSVSFSYKDCSGATIANPTSTPDVARSIARIDMIVTASHGTSKVAGLNVTRTESESVDLRNNPCL